MHLKKSTIFMASSSSSGGLSVEDQMRDEIARLTGNVSSCFNSSY